MELTSVLRKYAVVALSAAVLSLVSVAQPAVADDDLDAASELMEDTLDAMDDFNDILDSCTDRESADIAAPKLVRKADELKECIRRAERLDVNLTDAEKARFMARKPEYEKEIDEERAELNALIDHIGANNAFGSDALISALKTVSEVLGD